MSQGPPTASGRGKEVKLLVQTETGFGYSSPSDLLSEVISKADPLRLACPAGARALVPEDIDGRTVKDIKAIAPYRRPVLTPLPNAASTASRAQAPSSAPVASSAMPVTLDYSQESASDGPDTPNDALPAGSAAAASSSSDRPESRPAPA